MDIIIVDEPEGFFDSPVEEITVEDTPDSSMWKLSPLYKKNLNGKLDIWQIGFNGEYLFIRFGNVDGVITHERTTPETKDPLTNARRRFINKYKSGYFQGSNDFNNHKMAMRGYKYEAKKTLKFPVLTQIKIDGIRCHVTCENGSIIKRSSKNNPILSIDHIDKEIKEFFCYLPQDSIIDSEIYSPDYTFNELISIVRRTVNFKEESEDLSIYIFDLIWDINLPYEYRYLKLLKAYDKYIKDGNRNTHFHILNSDIVKSQKEMDKYYEKYLGRGFEGMMIKKISNGANVGTREYSSSLHVNGKTNNILKLKPLDDEEGEVIGVEIAKGSEEGCAILQIKDPRDNIFTLRMGGSFDRRIKWAKHPKKIIGKFVTYKYQGLSEYGVPRFPVGKAVRDYD
jgi:DNA ligase-1